MFQTMKQHAPVVEPANPWQALYGNRYLSWARRKAATLAAPLLPKKARWLKIRGGLLEGHWICAELRHGEKSYWLGVFEPEVQRALQSLGERCADLRCIYDVGAHIGFHSMALAHCFPRSRVIAFEPRPRNYERLGLNVRRNGLEQRIILVGRAVSDESHAMEFYLGDSTWSGGLVHDHRDNYKGQLTVFATTLDDLVFREQYPPPELIKIDAEGAEAQVIRGASRVLKEYRPMLITEVHHPEAAAEVFRLLEVAGYELESLGVEESPQDKNGDPTGHFLARFR